MELWDLYTASGERTGRFAKRGHRLAQGDYHIAVELWISNPAGELLIQHRSAQKRSMPGVWAMTTGCVTVGETSCEGVLREAHEELGLILSSEALKFLRRIIRPKTGVLWDIWMVRLTEIRPTLSLQTEEVDGTRWMMPSELQPLLCAGNFFCYPEITEVLSQVRHWMDHR